MGIYYFNSEKFVNKIIVIFLKDTKWCFTEYIFFLMIKMSFLRDIVYSRIEELVSCSFDIIHHVTLGKHLHFYM